MTDAQLTDLEYEILDTICQSDETTRIIVHDIRNPANAEWFSDAAKALDFASLDAVFEKLLERGLVSRKQELTDGFERPAPGVTYTWWSITTDGLRVWRAWDEAHPD